MSPYHVIREDDDGERHEIADEVTVTVDLNVREIRVRHFEVSLFDEQGRESAVITRGTYPGAGMGVSLADHVKTT